MLPPLYFNAEIDTLYTSLPAAQNVNFKPVFNQTATEHEQTTKKKLWSINPNTEVMLDLTPTLAAEIALRHCRQIVMPV